MGLDDEIRVLDRLVADGLVAPGARPAALATLTRPPTRAEWAAFLHPFGLAVGTASALAGVLYLVAFNWAALGFLPKLAGAAALVVASTATAAWAGPRSLVGTLGCVAGAVTAGAPLVLYSQYWQSGADPWLLFAVWAGLGVPFALASRSPAAWAVVIVLADVALQTGVTPFGLQVGAVVWTTAAVVHLGLGLAARGRWLEHALRLFAAWVLFSHGAWAVIESEAAGAPAFALGVLGGLGLQVGYPSGRVGGPAATMALTTAVGLLFVGGCRWWVDQDPGLVLLLFGPGLALLLAVVGSFAWLLGVPRHRARQGDA